MYIYISIYMYIYLYIFNIHIYIYNKQIFYINIRKRLGEHFYESGNQTLTLSWKLYDALFCKTHGGEIIVTLFFQKKHPFWQISDASPFF